MITQQEAFIKIRLYAAASYLYYKCPDRQSMITDGEFDELCEWLLTNYDDLKPFDINNYINKDELEAGSGYNIAYKVCGQTRDWALDNSKIIK